MYLIGTDELAPELRVRTCLEMMIHQSEYLAHPSASDLLLMSSNYDIAIKDCATNGSSICIWALFALATVIGRTIISIYPMAPPTLHNFALGIKVANTSLLPLHRLEDNMGEPVHIMWMRLAMPALKDSSVWEPNHFVPLLIYQI